MYKIIVITMKYPRMNNITMNCIASNLVYINVYKYIYCKMLTMGWESE